MRHCRLLAAWRRLGTLTFLKILSIWALDNGVETSYIAVGTLSGLGDPGRSHCSPSETTPELNSMTEYILHRFV